MTAGMDIQIASDAKKVAYSVASNMETAGPKRQHIFSANIQRQNAASIANADEKARTAIPGADSGDPAANALDWLLDERPSQIVRRAASPGYEPNARNTFEVFSELSRMGVAAENILNAAQARMKFHEMVMRKMLEV
jgi:hypothetical protein